MRTATGWKRQVGCLVNGGADGITSKFHGHKSRHYKRTNQLQMQNGRACCKEIALQVQLHHDAEAGTYKVRFDSSDTLRE